MSPIMSLADAEDRYGKIEERQAPGGDPALVWPNASAFCEIYSVPQDLHGYLLNSVTRVPTKRIYANRDFIPYLHKAFLNVLDRGLMGQLKTYDGCWNVRYVRGKTGRVSSHAYGLAIDINAATNRLDTYGDISLALAACFTDAGLIHGRGFKRPDPQHFSLGW